MKTEYSTAEGQIRLMRESVGHETHFPREAGSTFKAGDVLQHVEINLRHPSHNVVFLRDGKPEGRNAVIVVKHTSGVTGEWFARDFRLLES